MKKQLYIFAVAALGKGLSGSDRIFIEFSKRWGQKFDIKVIVWEEGYEMCKRNRLNNVKFSILKVGWLKKLGFGFSYIYRIFLSSRYALTTQLINSNQTYIYSASDFWQDLLPCLILKMRFSKIVFIGSYYLSLPNPFYGYYEDTKQLKLPNFNNIILYILQKPVKKLLIKYADIIFVTSEPDKKWFKDKKIVVIKGGVDVLESEKYFSSSFKEAKIYDGCFLGRFHEQKGVIDLVEIWSKVVANYPESKLIMMGDGPEMTNVKERIKKLGLEKNIILTGYMFDGYDKDNIFKKSKLILHPAKYDSGGMASAEGMAWGLPGVSYNLKALKTYYAKGMIKVEPVGNFNKFANAIIKLLKDKPVYDKLSKEAREYTWNTWSWETRSKEILEKIL